MAATALVFETLHKPRSKRRVAVEPHLVAKPPRDWPSYNERERERERRTVAAKSSQSMRSLCSLQLLTQEGRPRAYSIVDGPIANGDDRPFHPPGYTGRQYLKCIIHDAVICAVCGESALYGRAKLEAPCGTWSRVVANTVSGFSSWMWDSGLDPLLLGLG